MNRESSAIRVWLAGVVCTLPGAAVLQRWKSRMGGSRQIRAILEQLERQKEVDKRLRAELDSGAYSLERPLIILNPYGDSPLTAVALFETSSPSRIAVSVRGADVACSVDFVFDDYHTRHLVPVYGLYADAENEVLLRATGRNGGVAESVLKIRTDRLPPGLEDVRVDILTADTPRSQTGFTFLYRCTPKFAFDACGDIRWFLNLKTNQAALYDFEGHMVLTSGGIHGEALLYEIDLLGRFYSIMSVPYGAHHDIEDVGGGRLLVTGTGRGRSIQDLLYECDLCTGKIGPVLDFRSVLDPSRPSIDRTRLDWLHMNAVKWSGSDNSIVVSARNQSAVVKLAYPGGEIKWILGNHDNWLPEYMKYLLTPKGQNFKWPYAQHAPTILPRQDKHPDTVDIMLFDNHNFADNKLEAMPRPRYSRLVQYRIDEKAKTVEQVWEFGRERGNELFSDHCGVADYLPNGNVLGYFSLVRGHRVGYSRIVELLHDTQEVVFDAVIYDETGGPLTDYRAARRELYSRSDNDLYKLEPCRENIPQNVRKQKNEP